MLTLLTASLILGSLIQDAPATAAPAVAQDPKALMVLEEFDDQLYSPAKDGLETLSFDIEMPGPGGVPSGTLSITWSVADGAKGVFEFSAAMLAQIPEAMHEMAKEQSNAQMGPAADQISLIQTNGIVGDVLTSSHVALAGVDGGYVKVMAEPREAGKGSTRTLLFEDGLLAKTIQMVPSPMGGESESTGLLNWVPVEEDSDLLVLGSTTETTSGMAQTSTFVREKLGGFYFVTRIEGESAMGQASTMHFSNFVVNGKAIAQAEVEEPEMVEEVPDEG